MSSSMRTSGGESGQKNRLIRSAVICLLLLAVVFAGLQISLPLYTAQQFAAEIHREWGIDPRPRVRVGALPFYKIWQGEMDSLEITGGPTAFSDLVVDKWEVKLSRVSIVRDENDELDMQFADGSGYAEIGEASLESYLRSSAVNIVHPRVVITEDHIVYTGRWDSGIVLISFSVVGLPYIGEEDEIRMRLDRITVGPFDIPHIIRDITESFLVQVFSDDDGLGFANMRIVDIALAEGIIRVVFEK